MRDLSLYERIEPLGVSVASRIACVTAVSCSMCKMLPA